MNYNKTLTEKEINSLKELKKSLFVQVGKYEVQKYYYEQKIREQMEQLDSINKRLYEWG